jgi:hypothetical protein
MEQVNRASASQGVWMTLTVERHGRRGWEQQGFELGVVELGYRGPGQAGAGGARQVLADRALAQPQAVGNGALR